MENSYIKQLNGMLYTLGNVNTNGSTKTIFPNPDAESITARRSQELYDAITKKLNIQAWACGRYGERQYSPELGKDYAKKLFEKVKSKTNFNFDYSIQMAGHPIINYPHPSFLIVDFIPFFDLSVMDTVHFPYVTKTYERDQDFLYYNATGIITYTPVQRYMLINWLKLDPCKVTSICSGVTGFVPQSHKKVYSKNILWVGADFDRKGGADVIEAYLQLKNIDPEYTLTLVGIDRDYSDIEGVNVYPFMTNDFKQLNALYDEAGVLVMPSYKENLGLVYLEAMAHKTPVIVTTRGGFAEIIRRTGGGIIVKPGCVSELVDGIKNILNPSKFNSYAEQAYHFATHNATWDIAASRMVDAMDRWLTNRSVPDDYNDYSICEDYENYNSRITDGIR